MAENKNIEVGGRLHSIASGNVLVGANEIFDDDKGKKQSDINTEIDAALEDRYTKEQTYSKSELNNMITTPNQEYVTVTATNQTTDITDVLPATGKADTVYRVGNWNGSQFDGSAYSEYAWSGSQYVHINTKTQVGEVFNISTYHATGGVLAKYDDLTAALDSNNSGGVPQSLQKGGMSVKFVQSSNNKYVLYRLMATAWSTNTADWQGVDKIPTAESDNLVTSGGVRGELKGIEESLYGEGQGYEPEKTYFIIQLDNKSSLDIRSVWDSTNIKNEVSGSCIIDFGDGSGPVSIVDRGSMLKENVPAGTYIVSITGITSVVGNTMLRESSSLIGAKLPSTLRIVSGWLFNGVPNMSEVTFMGTTPPTFSGEGISGNSLNLVSVINVPESALSAYQSSTMSDVMKSKLKGISEGIVANIANIKTDVTNLQTGLSNTKESVKELADYVDSKFPEPIDKTKTYFTIEVPAGNIDLRTIYNSTNIKNETAGTCTIDYGDGTPIVSISSADDLLHNYAQGGTYTLVVTGLTGLTSNLFFRESKILKDAKFGTTFVNPSTYMMLLSVAIDSVTFFATTPLTWSLDALGTMNMVTKIIVPKDSLLSYLKAWYFNDVPISKDLLTKKIVPDEPVDYYYNPVTVTVGQSGDFSSLNDAIQSLSTSYSIYQYGGLKVVVKILSGTTITEQIYVDGLDLSWITIEYEDYNPASFNYDNVAESIANGTIIFDTTEGYNSVAVDASSWTSAGITHDTRGDVCLFRAENGGRLPIINCVFKLTIPNSSYPACGCLCNRGSEAIIKTLCGFIGFQDGVISNNESSITIREGITMNCSRWGCHARHNGEVSARSVIATGCATDVAYASEYGAAVADRVADMDVREAYLGGNYAIRCHNASSICARATHVIGGGVENAYLVQATYSGRINASGMTFTGITEGSKMYEVLYAGWIDTFGVTGKTYNVTTLNTINDNNGIIWG